MSHDISKALATYTKKELGIRLNLRTYRQYMAFITNSNQAVVAATTEGET